MSMSTRTNRKTPMRVALLCALALWLSLDARVTGAAPLATDTASSPPHRVITISTLALLDSPDRQSADYVVGEIKKAAVLRPRHDLIVVPLTPFLSFDEGKEPEGLAEFALMAREYRTYLAAALTERAKDGRTFLTAVLFDRGGNVAGKYRKSHALPDDDIFALGDELPVFATDFGPVGLTLGTDIYFQEIYAVMAAKGAALLTWQHAPERLRDHALWPPILAARAMDNKTPLVAAMYADPRPYLTHDWASGIQGAEWGHSLILSRVGATLADTAYSDGAASAVIDLDKRKVSIYPEPKTEDIFFVINSGGRGPFGPIAQKWEKPELPAFERRTARVAVAHLTSEAIWRRGMESPPPAMLEALDEAARVKPDILLLTEMSAFHITDPDHPAARLIGERARAMNAWIIIGGMGRADRAGGSVAWVWNRQGERVFTQPIYWQKGYDEVRTLDTDFARIGIYECGDLHVSELQRILALKGAEIIFDPSMAWGADGFNNLRMLQARAIDNGVWLACAHYNHSDPGLRSLVLDPYGQVLAGSHYDRTSVVYTDIDFDKGRVYYAGEKAQQPRRVAGDTGAYVFGVVPDRQAGWREMFFARRRPELYSPLQ